MAKLVVSTWVRDHRQQQMTRSSPRLQSLRNAIQATAARIGASKYRSGGLIKGIFVAPEYFFAAKWAGLESTGGGTFTRSIGRTKHNELLRKITAISREFPRILILPGTIAWRKRINVGELKARIRYYEGRRTHKPPLSGDQLNRALRSEFQRCTINGEVYDTIDRQDYLAANQSPMPTVPLSDAEFDDIRTRLPTVYDSMVAIVNDMNERFLSQGSEKLQQRYFANPSAFTHMMQNTAYAFLNGQVVFHYSKQGNFNEEVGDDTLVFAPGARSGIQQIEGIRFGFEVCLDHCAGTLSRQLREGRQLDVQVVMSDAVDYKSAHAVVREGGFFIHASTEPSVTGVWQMNQHRAVPAPSLGANVVDGTALTHWDMEVDVDDPFALSGTFMQNPGSLFPAKKWTVQTPKNPFRSLG